MAASAFTNTFRIPELRKRLFFTLGMLAIYRLGIFVTTPGAVMGQELTGIENIRNAFLTRYSILTNGQGLVQVAATPKDELPVNPGVRPPATVPRTLLSLPDSCVRDSNASGRPSGVSSSVSVVARLTRVPARSSSIRMRWVVTTRSARTSRVVCMLPTLRPPSSTLIQVSSAPAACAIVVVSSSSASKARRCMGRSGERGASMDLSYHSEVLTIA